ncbi:hypothetical protein [Sphingomonas sp. R-74633]|uniref:hypothetical protein n=1 Tax=Sphingomonas sp. R-74633 TaxID=2751188 RepID=UPI0015D274FD|nr:hypothetical protein [Sphingomonas sp. R-74633]
MVVAIGFEIWVVLDRLSGAYLPASFAVVTFGAIALHLALNLVLRHFIMVRPRRAARTTFAALLGLGTAYLLYVIGEEIRVLGTLLLSWRTGFIVLSLAAQFGLMWLLFRPDADAWLRGEAPDPPELLEETFS